MTRKNLGGKPSGAVKIPVQWTLIGLVVVLAVVLLVPRGPGGGQAQSGAQAGTVLTPASSWPHTHGLGVDPQNPRILYIGTHGLGLVQMEIGGQPMRVGSNTLDLMGYTPHPLNGRIHYSSGHPGTGGNLGVVKSEDGGMTWRRIDSLGRAVDFHAMTVSPANPGTLYAWYYGDRKFYRSTDGGVTWTNPPASGLPEASALAADPFEENTVWAGARTGLFRSTDGGASWAPVESGLPGSVIALAIDPKDAAVIYASTQFGGVWKSTNGGKSFVPVGRGLPPGDAAVHLAVDPVNSDNVYAALVSTAIYGSSDGGATWQLLRPGR